MGRGGVGAGPAGRQAGRQQRGWWQVRPVTRVLLHSLTSPPRAPSLAHHPQGSAADLAKAAMVGIHGALARELPPGGARLVLQIHDEFLLEVAGARCVPWSRARARCVGVGACQRVTGGQQHRQARSIEPPPRIPCPLQSRCWSAWRAWCSASWRGRPPRRRWVGAPAGWWRAVHGLVLRVSRRGERASRGPAPAHHPLPGRSCACRCACAWRRGPPGASCRSCSCSPASRPRDAGPLAKQPPPAHQPLIAASTACSSCCPLPLRCFRPHLIMLARLLLTLT